MATQIFTDFSFIVTTQLSDIFVILRQTITTKVCKALVVKIGFIFSRLEQLPFIFILIRVNPRTIPTISESYFVTLPCILGENTA